MQRLTRTLLVAVVAVASLACVQVHHPRPLPSGTRVTEPGPPPHAPAHGYRHKHLTAGVKVELSFDSLLGVYVVVGWPRHYYAGGRFYRQADGAWYVSTEFKARWVALDAGRLPRGLAKKAARGKRKKPRAGSHPAKHDY